MSTPLTSVGLCGCKPAQEAAWSICRECLSSNQIFVIINTQIYLQEVPAKGMPQWGSPAAPERGYHTLSSTILEFFKKKLAHWEKHFARRPRDHCHCSTSIWTEIQQYNILLSSLVQVSTCEPHTECCTWKKCKQERNSNSHWCASLTPSPTHPPSPLHIYGFEFPYSSQHPPQHPSCWTTQGSFSTSKEEPEEQLPRFLET